MVYSKATPFGGSGSGTDEQIKVSSNDTTAKYLEDAIVPADTKLTISILNDGSDEDLQIAVNEGNINHDNLSGFVANEHIDWTGATQNLITTGTLEATTSLELNGSTSGSIILRAAATAGTFDFTLPTDTPTDGQVLTWNTGNLLSWEDNAGGLGNVVEDTTPQLGGNLDVNGNSIVSTSAGNISITPDTTGDLILDGLKWPQADGSADQVLKTDGAGQLSWVANAGSGIANVVDDTTPQLGGDLDCNTYNILLDSGDKLILDGDGDSDTYILESHADEIKAFAGGAEKMVIADGYVAVTGQVGSYANSLGNKATSFSIDLDDGNVQTFTLTGNCTISALSNPREGFSYIIKAIQDGSGSHTLTWTPTIYWVGNGTTDPTLTTTASHWDIYTLTYVDSTWQGVASQDFG